MLVFRDICESNNDKSYPIFDIGARIGLVYVVNVDSLVQGC